MKIVLLFVIAINLFLQIDPCRVDNPSYRVSVLKDRYTLLRSDIFYFLETSPHRPFFQVKTAESCDDGKLYIYFVSTSFFPRPNKRVLCSGAVWPSHITERTGAQCPRLFQTGDFEQRTFCQLWLSL